MSRKTVRRIQRVFQVVCILGFVLLLGTAGASDCGQIGMRQIMLQGCIGLLVFTGGAWLGGLMT